MSERRKIVDRMASVHYDAIDEGEQPWETLSFAFRFDVAEQFEPVYDAIVAPLLAEVERLRGEVARQAEQITAVRKLADRHEVGCSTELHALSCDCRFGDIRAVVNA